MSKENFRYINTRFWDDNYIVELDPSEKLLFLYFLTNPLTNLCGIYEISYKRIASDTGFDKEMIDRILKRFSNNDKIIYVNGWVCVKNFSKNQRYRGDKLEKAMELEREKIPPSILEEITNISNKQIPYQYPSDTQAQRIKNKDKRIKNIDKGFSTKVDDSEINSQIVEIFNLFKSINPTINFGHTGNRSAVKDLIKQFGYEKTVNTVKYAISIQGQPYSPTITTPYQLKENMGKLLIYYKRESTPQKGGITILE